MQVEVGPPNRVVLSQDEAAEVASLIRRVPASGHDEQTRVFNWVMNLEAAAGVTDAR